VSGAAGAVGSIAGQIAKIKGKNGLKKLLYIKAFISFIHIYIYI